MRKNLTSWKSFNHPKRKLNHHEKAILEFNSLEETSSTSHLSKSLIPGKFEHHLKKLQSSHLKKFIYFENISRPTPWKINFNSHEKTFNSLKKLNPQPIQKKSQPHEKI